MHGSVHGQFRGYTAPATASVSDHTPRPMVGPLFLPRTLPPQQDRQPAGDHARHGAGPQGNAHATGHHLDLEHEAEDVGEGDQGEEDGGEARNGLHGPPSSLAAGEA